MLGRDPVRRPPACDTGEHSTPAAGGRDPRGGAAQRPPGRAAGAEKVCAGAVLVPVSALPGGSAPGRGVCRRGGLVAGLRVDVSRSAVLGFSSATHPAAVKPIHDFLSHYSAPALYVRRYPLPATLLTGAKRGRS